MLMAAIVEQENSGALYRKFDRSRLFRCQRLSESFQRLSILVSVLA
jgi:hypothetical protein